MANTMTLISTATVGSGGAATISFTSIPSTYTDLKVIYCFKPPAGDVGIKINFNSTTSGYSDIYIQALNTTSTPSALAKGTNVFAGVAAYGGAIADSSLSSGNLFNNAELYVPNYTASQYKAFVVSNVGEADRNLGFIEEISSLWSNNAAIDRIDFTVNGGGNFAQYSTASLYGIKNS
jgi:hypothetical protein